MYIFKNALRNISRAKGRSILIGIIITIIALSVCIGLCIRQSAQEAKDTALEDLTITAQISPDREAAMEKARGGESGQPPENSDGTFDKNKLKEAMGESLSLDDLEKYAKADSVKSFYYSLSASLDAAGDLEAYSTTNDSSSSASKGMPNMGGMMDSGDFSIVGYSSDEAMSDFTDGTCTIEDGKVFEEGTKKMVCIVSSELAEYNSLKVGDYITLANPENEDETYKLKIVGTYKNSQASATAAMGGMGRGFTDPANYIYMSYGTLNSIAEKSESANSNEDDGTAIIASLNGTYVVGDMDGYQSFQKEAQEIGLEDGYTVTSSDLTAYEQSAEPLENLAKFAGYFLLVILGIGAIILIVLNIFSTRERKYEIGVLTAIGMTKKKVAQLFMSEILIITLAAVIIGGAIGSAISVPVTNSLLASQIESQQSQQDGRNQAFGRDFGGGGPGGDQAQSSSDTQSDDQTQDEASKPSDAGTKGPIGNYISKVSAAVNVIVLLELLACCILLALIAGAVSVIAIMRYEPLQILANRD